MVYRLDKGSELTDAEIEGNFNECNYEKSTLPIISGGFITNFSKFIYYLMGDGLTMVDDQTGEIFGTGVIRAIEHNKIGSDAVTVS